MLKLGQRLQIFIFGLTVGLLIGCLFFIFKLDDYFTKFSFSNNKNNTQVVEEVISDPDANKVAEKEGKTPKRPVQKLKTESDSSQKNSNSLTYDNSSLQL
ncbi:MAG: hypothetical protein ACJ76F_09380 [Bacteroidia bacterium]